MLLLLLQLHLLQLLQQLLRSFGSVLLSLILLLRLLLLVLRCRRLLHCRRLIGRVLRILVGGDRFVARIFIALLLCLGARLLPLLRRSAGHGRSALGARRQNYALHDFGTIGAPEHDIIKTGSREDAGQNVAFRRWAQVYGHAF